MEQRERRRTVASMDSEWVRLGDQKPGTVFATKDGRHGLLTTMGGSRGALAVSETTGAPCPRTNWCGWSPFPASGPSR